MAGGSTAEEEVSGSGLAAEEGALGGSAALLSRANAQRPKVVYVMGSGRSGSTILGVALGNCGGVFYAGELDNWLPRAGEPLLGGTERTRFWAAVRERVPGASDLFGRDCQRLLERSSAVMCPHRWRQRRRLRARYRAVNEDLYHAIAGVASATHVIDTSHFPLRARELQRLPDIDLYLIYLIRDPQAVVASFNLHIGRGDVAERRLRTLVTNANLWLTHLLSLLVFLRHPCERRLLLRHEDLLADPEGVLRELLARLDCAAELPDLGSLSTGFPLNGNRFIGSERVALRRRVLRPRRDSWLTALLQAPWSFVLARLGPTLAPHEHVCG
jgi:hypothetical protein